MPVSSEATSNVKNSLDSATSDPKSGIPGVVFVSVDKNGKTLAAHTSGHRSIKGGEPMTLDTVFWIASCTKLITAISCMQLVEQGKVKLDDATSVYELCPEIKDKKVLGEDGKLEERKGDITLRMLLDHTAGFGYTFFNEQLTAFGRPVGFDEFMGDAEDVLSMPLVNQPGKMWEYGTNLDWVGILVERASGLKLNDYFTKNVFEPLGLKNISMFPTAEMKSQLASMHQRDPATGAITERDHLYRRPLNASSAAEKDRIFNSGGAGCFGTPTEYCQILATLLNDGVAPSGARILKKETVDTMFTNSIPQFPEFARQGVNAAKADLSNSPPELYPQGGNPPQGWGLSFMITEQAGETGRGRNTAWWAGLANLFWWADRERGVAGMIATQVLPFGDGNVLGQWVACEKAVYDGLE